MTMYGSTRLSVVLALAMAALPACGAGRPGPTPQTTLNGAQGVKISTVTFPNSKVKFTSLGAPDNAGSVTLTCSSRSYVVSVAAVTGRVTINPGP